MRREKRRSEEIDATHIYIVYMYIVSIVFPGWKVPVRLFQFRTSHTYSIPLPRDRLRCGHMRDETAHVSIRPPPLGTMGEGSHTSLRRQSSSSQSSPSSPSRRKSVAEKDRDLIMQELRGLLREKLAMSHVFFTACDTSEVCASEHRACHQ